MYHVIHVTFHSIRAHVIYPIMDTAIFKLQSRFEGHHLVSKLFTFLSTIRCMLNLSDNDLKIAANGLQNAYSDDLGSSNCVSQLCSFRREFNTEIAASESILDLLRLMSSSGILPLGVRTFMLKPVTQLLGFAITRIGNLYAAVINGNISVAMDAIKPVRNVGPRTAHLTSESAN